MGLLWKGDGYISGEEWLSSLKSVIVVTVFYFIIEFENCFWCKVFANFKVWGVLYRFYYCCLRAEWFTPLGVFCSIAEFEAFITLFDFCDKLLRCYLTYLSFLISDSLLLLLIYFPLIPFIISIWSACGYTFWYTCLLTVNILFRIKFRLLNLSLLLLNDTLLVKAVF